MDDLVSENYVWNVIHDFHKKVGLLAHQKESYDYFISNGIDNIIQESDVVVEQSDLKYIAKFKNAYVPSPTIIDEDRKIKILYPTEALKRDLNYESTIYVDIDEIFNVEGEKPEIISHKRVELAKIPIMLLTEKCNLSSLTENERIEKNECYHDNGGYFIIKGKERVLVGQIRGIYNQPIVISPKAGDKYKYTCDIRSMSEETGHSVLLQCKIGVDDRTLVFSLPNIKDNIPVGIVFKALGFTEEKDIINLIGNKNKEVEKYLKYIIRDSFHITTQKDALKYIGQFAMHIIKDENREKYALQIVENELLPHMGITATIKEKAIYLGFVVSKLLNTHLGLRKEDDRDNYINKRVEMAGILCNDLFRTLFKRYIKNVQLQLEKKKQRPDILSVMNRMSSITVGLKHSFCFPAGTNVSMTSGLSYPIEKLSEFEDDYEKVLGFNGTGIVSTNHGGLVNQGIKDTIKLTFEDGRVLSCTPDHKILVLNQDKSTSWIEALKIPINSRIVIGLDNPLDNIEEDLNNNWELVTKYETLNKLENHIWKVSSKEERNKTLAFMRILGYIICDGHLPLIKKNQGVIYFGTLFDVECFINDYKLVIGIDKNPTINESYTDKWGSTYTIRISNKLSNILRNIDGVIIGKKVTNIRSIPTFLLEDNCPKSVIREFLAGLFGGDGYSPRLDIRKGSRTCIDSIKFSWTTQQINIDMLKKTFENIKFLLEKVNVKNTYINGPYIPSSGPKDRLYYRLNLACNTDFHKYVGFRYCIHKTYKLNIVSSYWRMEEEIKRQHSFIINNVNKIKKENKKITIKEALDISRKELINKEYILNNYYSLSSEKDITKRRETGRSIDLKYLQEKFGVIDAKDFIDNMGALYMFEGEYTTQRDSFELPYFSLKLMDIRNDKPQIVYDITNVKICKSFFAIGIAVSNSTGNWGVQKNNYIRTGVSQVLARMNYGSTLSHLRRCVIPIGKEGKNAKIRQTHPSQIMYLCPNETPEGQSIGIVLNLALMTKISLKIPTVVVKEIIEGCFYFTFIDDIKLEENIYPKIFVNGILIGVTKEPENFINELKDYHKNNLLDKSISFTFDKEENEIKIFSDEGRLLRPVFTINEENRLNIKEDVKVDWKMLVEEGYVKYIDNCEVENSVIAMDQTDLKKFKCDYCEIHPSMMMGVMSNSIPFPDHSQCIWKEEPVYMADGTTKRICDIEIGDKVITFDPDTKEQTITDVIHTETHPTEKELFEITTYSNRKITATFDHRFMTSEGWKRLEHLKVDETLIAISVDPFMQYDKIIDEHIKNEYHKCDSKIKNKINFDEWKNRIKAVNSMLFIPILSIVKSKENIISDITVNSKNQSFLCGDTFCVHNSPRNIYQSSMSKQAIGIYATSFQHRSDTITHVLNYVQRPLVSTLPSQFIGFNDMPMGMNLIVAIMTYGGFNQEDAVILNKGAVDRGLFHTTSFRTLMTEEKKQGSNNFETICIPPIDKRKKNANYSFLDENGIVKKRVNGKCVYVEKGDVIIGKTLTKTNKSSLEEEITDVSYVIKSGEEGFIDRIFDTITPNGYKMVKVVIRNNKIPEIGDKLASFREGVCEALTIDGWKPIEEITLDDKVAILDNDNVKYENPTETYCYDYNGKLYELKSQQIELSVTHNHRMWIKKRYGAGSKYKDEFEFMTADKCFGKRLKYKKNINNFEPEDWIGEYFIIPEFSVKMDDWLVFFGIWIAEGWTHGNSTIIAANKHRVQKAYEKSCENMGFLIDKRENEEDNIIERLNGDIVQTGSGYKWYIHNKDLTNYMKQFSVGAVDKFLPDWVWSLNKEQCRLLLTSLELGDGHTTKTNNRTYYTSSKRLCDDITRLALHAGYSTNCRVPEGRKAGTQAILKDGRIITSNKDNWLITIIKTKTEPEINHGHINTQEGQSEEWVDYNGKVYCLSVRTGVFLVRQNGKPVWSGNSRAAQKGTIGMIYAQEDMPFTQDGITPDVILNSHAIPSRMTINVLLETLLGKSCLLEGTFGDATPFTSNSVNIAEKLCERLQNNGYEKHGWEQLINGFTGEPLKAKVYFGPTFYQRWISALVVCQNTASLNYSRQHFQIAGTSRQVFNTNLY